MTPWFLLLLLLSVNAEETTTITQTNYITPKWFMDAIQTALANNPENQDSGIKIIFVDGPDQTSTSGGYIPSATPGAIVGTPVPNSPLADGTVTPKTRVTSSLIYYPVSTNSVNYNTVTDCQGSTCTTHVNSETVPYVFTTSAYTHLTTTVADDDNTSSTSGKHTIYETQTDTENSQVNKLITKSASTTTKTIFSATTTPTTTFAASTSDISVATTQRDPLVSGNVVSKSQSFTIKTDFSDSVTISESIQSYSTDPSFSSDDYDVSASSDPSDPTGSSDPSDSSDPASSSGASASNSSFTSTIDLRISSSSTPIPSGGAKLYYNTTSGALSSSELSSSGLISSSIITNVGTSTIAKLVPTSSASSSSVKFSSVSVTDSASIQSPSAVSSTMLPSSPDTVSAGDLFKAISTNEPPSVFPREELPVDPASGVDSNGPYQTNKFFTNLLLSDGQADMIWSYPYGMLYKNQDYYGFGVQHTNASDRVFGPKSENTDGDTYFFNPTGNLEVIISGDVLGDGNNYIGVTNQKFMSATVTLSGTSSVGSDYIEIPVVQGMGFVTSIYHGSVTPELNSLTGFSSVLQETSDALSTNILKYRITLFTGVQYLMYVYVPNGASFDVSAKDSFHITGSKAIDGLIIQLAVAPTDSSNDAYYDEAAGAYADSASISGSASSSSADYAFTYDVKGTSSSGKTMIFALPHHVSSLSSDTASSKTPITLLSTTKGTMTGFLTNELKLQESLNPNVEFLPWSPLMSKSLSYSADQLSLIASAAQSDLNVDISSTVAGMDSNYFSGKVMDKYANILLVVHDILGDTDSAEAILKDMKTAFEVFTGNNQYYPLMYDTKYKGVTSTASQGGDTGADYGSGYYNDHHFHYGYFVHAAAVVGYIDSKFGGSWAQDNQEWVNSLIRDVANPSEDDSYFPVSRMFDWFAGHSWAGGLFASGDGRNEESSSEDYHFSYGMKLWGNVIGDASMEARGDLMLAVMKRSMNDYFLYSDDNDIVPKEMVPNKVSGIFFDNKIAFTTYFGDADTYPQYVHGIHMIPMTAATALIRGTDYVQQEWNTCIASFVDNLSDGWAGIIRLNQALIDPDTSYDFFSSDSFTSAYLDNGQSRTWSLAFAGGIANSS